MIFASDKNWHGVDHPLEHEKDWGCILLIAKPSWLRVDSARAYSPLGFQLPSFGFGLKAINWNPEEKKR